MYIKEEIKWDKGSFAKLCEQFQVKFLYAFGSSVSGGFDAETSDIDLLVDVDVEGPIVRGENLLLLWSASEKYFQRKVDLLTEKSLRNPYLKENIDKTKVLPYDGTKSEVLVRYIVCN